MHNTLHRVPPRPPPRATSSASGGAAKRRTPFAQQLDTIAGKRQLSAAQAGGGAPALAAEGAAQEASAMEAAATEEAEEAARAEREALLASEARALLKEAMGSVEAWVREAAAKGEANAAGGGANAARRGAVMETAPPDWELLGQRARLVGGTLGEALTDGLALTRKDFEAYQSLQKGGNMPTLVEELQGAADGLEGAISRGDGRLRSFAKQETPAEQRAERQRARASSLKTKQVGLAAALGERASKDASDTVVLGVMPGAKAVGRMAARRIADEIADGIAERDPRPEGILGRRRRDGAAEAEKRREAGGIVRELAKEIAEEYERDLKRAAELGPLADLAEAAKGPTSRLKKDAQAAKGVFEKAAGGLLLGAESAQQKAKERRRQLEERRGGGTEGAPMEPAAAAPAPAPAAKPSARAVEVEAVAVAVEAVAVEVEAMEVETAGEARAMRVDVEVEVEGGDASAPQKKMRFATAGGSRPAAAADDALDTDTVAFSSTAAAPLATMDSAAVEIEAVDVGVVRGECLNTVMPRAAAVDA